MWQKGYITILVVLLCGCKPQVTDQRAASPNDWLLSADSDTTRFTLIQQQFRGLDQPMWEVGERFERLHTALGRGNYPLAGYHWEKIRTAIENGIAKRPARRANAQALFLVPVWKDVDADIRSGDPQRAWAAFDRAKAACQSCHEAEKVAFMNDQPMFALVAPAAGGSGR